MITARLEILAGIVRLTDDEKLVASFMLGGDHERATIKALVRDQLIQGDQLKVPLEWRTAMRLELRAHGFQKGRWERSAAKGFDFAI